jgi:hypothetical protein
VTRPPATRLPLREVRGNLTYTRTSVTAWFVLQPVHWSMLTTGRQALMVGEQAAAWAGLSGRRVHLRVTSRPYPIAEWARALDRNTPAPLPGSPSFADHLRSAQERMRQATMAEKVVYLGVEVASRTPWSQVADAVLRKPAGWERKTVDHAVTDVSRYVTGPGMSGTPASSRDVEWLLHRSAGLGLPAPRLSPVDDGTWAAGDLGEFTDRVTTTAAPLGSHVVVADRDDPEAVRYLVVLTMGRVESLAVPDAGRSPWMSATDSLGVICERSAHLEVVPAPVTRERARKSLLRIRDQQGQYAQRGMDEPTHLTQRAAHARQIEDEATQGGDAVATRVSGQHRLAVAAKTPDALEDAVHQVVDLYAKRGITMVRTKGQLAAAREFVPGSRPAFGPDAHRRELAGRAVAAGMPTATSTVGDRSGPYLGMTRSTVLSPVCFDPHHATEVLGRSGLVPIVGEQGGGKSALLGSLAYWAAKRSVVTTLLDPSGPLAELCRMPDLAPYSQHIDLLRSPAGTLNPYVVIPEPQPWQYDDETGLEQAKHDARQERKGLARDVLRMLLPPGTARHDLTEQALILAAKDAGGEFGGSLFEVLDALRDQSDHGRMLAALLEEQGDSPHGGLFFTDQSLPAAARGGEPTLMVITMAGLHLPDRSTAPEFWSESQRMAVPLLHLAAHYATRRVYGHARNVRKFLGLDECHFLGMWPSGRALFNRLGRDSRKWNVAAAVSSQDPADVLGMDVANHVSSAFVGRIGDETLARESLRLLGLPEGAGFERRVMALSAATVGGTTRPREFAFRDAYGRTDVVSVDLAYLPALLDALNTNTTPTVPPLVGVA